MATAAGNHNKNNNSSSSITAAGLRSPRATLAGAQNYPNGDYAAGPPTTNNNADAAPAGRLSRSNSPAGSSYFTYRPYQQPQPSYQLQQQQQQSPQLPQLRHTNEQTLSNTLANAQSPAPASSPAAPGGPSSAPRSCPTSYPDAAGPVAAPVSLRPAKFTEEWDASQRGSSIVDGRRPVTPSRLQQQHPDHQPQGTMATSLSRANSISGASAAGGETAGGPSLSRGNTLKKKPSLRRGGSLRRSSSRRSMKAGSVRSLALQSSADQDEIHSAFFCPVPTTGNPTETLATRFQCLSRPCPSSPAPLCGSCMELTMGRRLVQPGARSSRT